MDYTKPEGDRGEHYKIDTYARGLADLAVKTHESVEYASDVDLDMAETRFELRYRVPDEQRLEWARQVVAEMGDRLPKDTREIYAREQVLLHERQSTEVVVQALRIGDVGIVTTPNETYALSGLKLKLQSPLEKTMAIELANGGDGYIPPPEQHVLGGYNTWPARSAGLEVQAEPKIVEAGLQLLEKVAGSSRRTYRQSRGPAADATLTLKPVAYWRLDEFAGPRAIDAVAGRDGVYEPGAVFFLEGPRSDAYCEGGEKNRAAHFAGGRMNARLPGLSDRYTLSLWFWNGMPDGARDVAGWMAGRGGDYAANGGCASLGLGGAGETQGKLIFAGDGVENDKIVGRTAVARWTWNHAALVRDGKRVAVYLNGAAEPEIESTLDDEAAGAVDAEQWFFGGRCDEESRWEGRLDEISVFDRPLTPEEIASLSAR